MIAGDFILTPDYDLATAAGDLVLAEADEQHQDLLLMTNTGEWRQAPLVGVGLLRYLAGPMGPTNRAQLQRLITIQLEKDGYTVATVTVGADSKIVLDAYRNA